MRIGAQGGFRVRQSDALEEGFGSCQGSGPAEVQMRARDFGDLLADWHDRVEAGGGVLEDEADVAAQGARVDRIWLAILRASLCPAATRGLKVRLFPLDRTSNLGGPWQQPRNRQRQRAFPRSAFADDRQFLTRLDIQVDAFQRRHLSIIAAITHREIPDGKQRRHRRLLRTAVLSTTPSPAR